MTPKLYNTLTRQIEEFTPLDPHGKKVTMYNCGPTVYNRVHIGNIRAFLLADILRRTLTFMGYEVRQVMNITDIDDKTINGSQAAGQSLVDFTRKYEAVFFQDLEKMNILRPTITPRATEHISEMIAMIEILLAKELAYKADDGVYFDVAKPQDYGALAQLEKRTGTRARIKNDEYDKENAQDFALWKFYAPEDGDVFWEAPFGKGRPGWHIECSAMSVKYLGETLDIHTGGIDLIFPHHTKEIAQSERCTDKQFVRYFVHNGFINVSNEKMAKSKGNFLTLGDIEERDISPLAFRYWLLTASYRTQVNFTWEALEGAQRAYDDLRKKIFEKQHPAPPTSLPTIIVDELESRLCADLNTAALIAWVQSLVQKQEHLGQSIEMIRRADEVLGLDLLGYVPENIEITTELQKLLDDRQTARDAKNYTESDRLRDKIKKMGYEVKDTTEGQTLTSIP